MTEQCELCGHETPIHMGYSDFVCASCGQPHTYEEASVIKLDEEQKTILLAHRRIEP